MIGIFDPYNNAAGTGSYHTAVTTCEEAIEMADGTTRHGKEIYCGWCPRSAIRKCVKSLRTVKSQLVQQDADHASEVMLDGCAKIDYEKSGFFIKSPEKRRANCRGYVQKHVSKITNRIGPPEVDIFGGWDEGGLDNKNNNGDDGDDDDLGFDTSNLTTYAIIGIGALLFFKYIRR
tara:strand:+ start:289 stop:816 length:528 start_codon:yes stop_codon:yes gene_type:complete